MWRIDARLFVDNQVTAEALMGAIQDAEADIVGSGRGEASYANLAALHGNGIPSAVLDRFTLAGPGEFTPNAIANPSAFGYPDETNTGPSGSLTSSGSITVSTANTVIEDLEVSGRIKIQAANVTVRNCRVLNTTAIYPIEITSSGTDALIQDVEIDGNAAASVAPYILGAGATLRRVNIHNAVDGPRIQADDVTIEDCYIHHLSRVSGGHHDCLQTRRGHRCHIARCTLLAYREDTGDHMNAVLQMGSHTSGPSGTWNDWVFEDCLINGGNYTINSGDAILNNAIFRNNRIGRNYRFGIYTTSQGWTITGNIWDDTLEPANANP